ncbi:hypothetical protein BHE90_001177 [Fusarium euwallaceae]|uniref:Apple domain-containing protein n=1 Tax=Fusarium euwallaceae TaxID=1147111 RepID=A0A430M8H7_9HYPO|nr:hypothetical protein BHE90_001177 [Fusarium euwallaceae]
MPIMRYSSIFFTFALSIIHAKADCIDGHREVISPGYTVEYICGLLRAGELHKGITSEKACAELCRDMGRTVCTYHAPTQRCVTDTEGGKESARADAVYMVKVEEPENEDPFALDCEGDKDACLQREASLNVKYKELLAEKNGMMAANCPSQHTRYGTINNREYRIWCSRHHDVEGFKEEHKNVYTLAACADLCTRRAWCNHVLHGQFWTVCRLYETPKVGHTVTPGVVSHEWNAAVKK